MRLFDEGLKLSDKSSKNISCFVSEDEGNHGIDEILNSNDEKW